MSKFGDKKKVSKFGDHNKNTHCIEANYLYIYIQVRLTTTFPGIVAGYMVSPLQCLIRVGQSLEPLPIVKHSRQIRHLGSYCAATVGMNGCDSSEVPANFTEAAEIKGVQEPYSEP